MEEIQSAEGTYIQPSRPESIIIIGVYVLAIIVALSIAYAAVAKFIIIPNMKSDIRNLKYVNHELVAAASNAESEIKTLKEENSKLRMEVRWNHFLSLMLDENQKVQFDGLDEYFKNNKNIYDIK